MESNINLTERIRQQFESSPYPRRPLEDYPHDKYDVLYQHSMVTPYYMSHQKVLDTQDKVILDAGCGSGWTSLILAVANPGAKIVGIDLSPESTKLAEYRLKHHGFENAEFHALAIEDLPQLGLEFDYINCDEVLYLLPEPVEGLKSLKSVLKPQGTIRTNLHSAMQRVNFFRAQDLFRMMGLVEDNPGDMEIEVVRETIESLKDAVTLKKATWFQPAFAQGKEESQKEAILMNYLLQGDKGYTVPELFAALEASGLEFISMLNWRQWEILDLFEDSENLPIFWAMGLSEASIQEKLHLFELLHPVHRLLDFWCTHANSSEAIVSVSDWEKSDWETATAYLHPVLHIEKVKEDLLDCIQAQRPFNIAKYMTKVVKTPIEIESHLAACLLPLWEAPQPVTSLVKRWLKIKPVRPDTLEPVSEEEAFTEMTTLLRRLEGLFYILLETAGAKDS